jgi:ribosomal protein L9
LPLIGIAVQKLKKERQKLERQEQEKLAAEQRERAQAEPQQQRCVLSGGQGCHTLGSIQVQII